MKTPEEKPILQRLAALETEILAITDCLDSAEEGEIISAPLIAAISYVHEVAGTIILRTFKDGRVKFTD